MLMWAVRKILSYYPIMMLFFLLIPLGTLLLPILCELDTITDEKHTNRTTILVPYMQVDSFQMRALGNTLFVWLLIIAITAVITSTMIVCHIVGYIIRHWCKFDLTFRLNLRRLGTYLYFVWVLIYLPTIIMSFLCFWYYYAYHTDTKELRDALLEHLSYQRDPAWPKVQYTFQCCGVDSYKDYGPYDTPDDSCCKVVSPHCADNALKDPTIASRLHQKGCFDDIQFEVNMSVQNITYPFQILSLSAMFMLMFVSILLFKYVRYYRSCMEIRPQNEEASVNIEDEDSCGSDGNETIETNAEDDEQLILTDDNNSDSENVTIENASNHAEVVVNEVLGNMENVAANIEENIFESDDEQLLEP